MSTDPTTAPRDLEEGARTWPGHCQSCGAGLSPPDSTWCPSCGASDYDESTCAPIPSPAPGEPGTDATEPAAECEYDCEERGRDCDHVPSSLAALDEPGTGPVITRGTVPCPDPAAHESTWTVVPDESGTGGGDFPREDEWPRSARTCDHGALFSAPCDDCPGGAALPGTVPGEEAPCCEAPMICGAQCQQETTRDERADLLRSIAEMEAKHRDACASWERRLTEAVRDAEQRGAARERGRIARWCDEQAWQCTAAAQNATVPETVLAHTAAAGAYGLAGDAARTASR